MNLADVTFTNHFVKQAQHKGFTADQIRVAIEQDLDIDPTAHVTRVTRHPGQLRYCGAGVAVVMAGNTAITIYEDMVVTPMRPDQMADSGALSSKRLASLR